MPSGKWFACFSCKIESKPMFKRERAVGIDLGLKSFAVLSDGTSIENPCYYRLYERRLKSLQRRLSKKEKGTRNREKARILVARLHEKIMNRRTDFLHKTSRAITNTFETVYVEDLRIRNMIKNHHLAKSISDVGWGRFMQMLCYKEEESGGRVIFVDPRGTSQMCSGCGEIVPKSLSNRLHVCPYCELVLDRDVNASRNVLKIGRGPPDYKPVETMTSAQPFRAGQVSSMKQEVPRFSGDSPPMT
jgi:putative transposase